jgi:hypothetical protein
MKDKDLDKLTKRPIQYWFEDGLGELVVASLFLLLGLLFTIEGLATNPTVIRIAAIVAMITMLGGAWIGRPLLRKMKERWTYPRTGYVAFRKPKRSRRGLNLVIILLICGLVVWLVTQVPESKLALTPLIEGIAVGGFYIYQGYLSNINRFYILGTLALILGTALALAGLGNLVGAGIFFIAFSVAMLISGGLALRAYLRFSQSPIEVSRE